MAEVGSKTVEVREVLVDGEPVLLLVEGTAYLKIANRWPPADPTEYTRRLRDEIVPAYNKACAAGRTKMCLECFRIFDVPKHARDDMQFCGGNCRVKHDRRDPDR